MVCFVFYRKAHDGLQRVSEQGGGNGGLSIVQNKHILAYGESFLTYKNIFDIL